MNKPGKVIEYIFPVNEGARNIDEMFIGVIRSHSQLIRCKDCKHRPKRIDNEGNGFDFEFPDEMCPCQCEDGWYNRMPKDNWFCGNGERREDNKIWLKMIDNNKI